MSQNEKLAQDSSNTKVTDAMVKNEKERVELSRTLLQESVGTQNDDNDEQSKTTYVVSEQSFKESDKSSYSTLKEGSDVIILEQGDLSDSALTSKHSSLTASTFGGKSTSRKSSMRRVSMTSRNPLDDMTNAELVKNVEDLQKNTKHLELENMVFLHFLEKNDRALIEDIDSSIIKAQVLQERASICSRRLTLTRLSRRSSAFINLSSNLSSSVITSTVQEKEGPRINVTQKTDLVLREMENIQAVLDKLNKKCHAVRHKLKAELEEMSIRESEIKETINNFESIFISETAEKYTQKNPADKFTRFMEDYLKQCRTSIDKIRLRTSSLKVQYQKICSQLTQKKLLGENLQEVDFDQLSIENKHLFNKIDQRNLLLLELKKMNGRANLLLSRHKKHLIRKMNDLKQFQDTIAFTEELIVKLDNEAETVGLELEKTKAEYDKIKTKSANYEVPAVLDYVKKKGELCVLKKNLKIWARRKQIKDGALTASLREMKQATGNLELKSSRFVNPHDPHIERGSIESTFEFMFQRKQKASEALKKNRSSRLVRKY